MVANDPGPQTVSGMKQSIDVTGTIFGHDLLLGTLKTDEAGRLMVLGGFGTSRSPTGEPAQGVTNQMWYDDVSDGPVWATIKLYDNNSQPLVEPAWVLVGVPRFAHPISSIVTLYDVAYEAATHLPAPYTLTPPPDVSFTRDIYPMLRRPILMQWVNATAATGHGPNGPGDFFDPPLFDQLRNNDKNAASAAYQTRQWVFKSLRNPPRTVGFQ